MRGWILDLYAEAPGRMVVWFKLEGGETRRLVDRWAPSLFVAADEQGLKAVEGNRGLGFSWSRRVRRLERATDRYESEVLELVVDDAKGLAPLAERVERSGGFGAYRLYNVDIPQEQTYLYENDLFPLARCEVEETRDGLSWELRDDAWACDYEVPPLRSVEVDVAIRRAGRMARVTDPIGSIGLKEGDGSVSRIEGGSEEGKIMRLVEEVRRLDPDIVFTQDGDSFVLPYLVERARANGISDSLRLDREGNVLEAPTKKGTSYFSYGKILFKPSAIRLQGRIHLDTNSSFVHRETGLEGFCEVSRVCRLPLHIASRASIGTALSSLQFYHATKDGILIPWKPAMAESFKTRAELLSADRGGFIFEPELGVHEGVGELDFSSLFPSIMWKKNISPETVRCACCPDSANRVPELGWNVCEKRPEGIVSKAVKILVEKRTRYKRLERMAESEQERARHSARRDALKWVAVACLPKESPVFIRQDGVDRYERIGEFVDRLVGDRVGVVECPPGVYVAGVDSNYKAKYCRVAYLIKKPNDRELLSFAMEDGRSLVTTPDHSFFVLQDGELRVKRAEELKVGEVVPSAKKTPPLGNRVRRIDLIERLASVLDPRAQQLWRVSGEQLKEAARAKWKVLAKAAAREGYSREGVRSWAESGIIPLRYFGLLEAGQGIRQALLIGSGSGDGKAAWLPAVLPLGEELGFFLGLYVAGGSAGRDFVRLEVGPDALDSARRAIARLFGAPSHVCREGGGRAFAIRVDSEGLVEALDKVFGLGSAGRKELKVPEVVFGSSERMALGFIEGMIAGDGFAKAVRSVNIGTTSKELLSQLAFLSTRLGLAFRIGDLQGGAGTIDFVGPETSRRITGWRLPRGARRGRVAPCTEDRPTCSHPQYERIPALESGLYALTRATGASSRPSVEPGRSMCPAGAGKKIAMIRAQRLGREESLMAERVDGLVGSDLGFVRIREILKTDSIPDYVYCFQLEAGEVPGFFTGRGVVLTRNCSGYLGHANAKFGRIDAHMAVCAWDRKVLVDAARVAERMGFRVLHGIVDSLWLKKEGAGEEDYGGLRRAIEAETGFAISFEGVYKWIAFTPSKVDGGVPVLNRYFGAYGDGRLKVRGIEARRHDTPPYLAGCQTEVLERLARAGGADEARGMVGECVEVFLGRAEALLERRVPVEALVFTRNLSKDPGEYANRSLTSAVADQLVREGVELHAGEGVRYVITDYRSRSPGRRAVAFELADERTAYDAGRYVELLAEACATVLEPFSRDCSAERLLGLARGKLLHAGRL